MKLKEYIERLKTGCKKWEIVLWWLVRLVMIAGMIESFVNADKYEDKIRTMMVGNLVLTFGWEIFQLFPEKHLFRHLPAAAQDFTSVYIVLTAFFGAYINFYYTVWWWDTLLHFVSGGLCVLAGYAFIKAYEERDGKKVPIPVAVLCAFSVSFMFGTLWECWEFSFDQFLGGDTQHWSLALAEESKINHMIFQPAKEFMSEEWKSRFALMDTMTDIVANTLGAVIGGITLKIALHKEEKEERAAENKKEKATVNV